LRKSKKKKLKRNCAYEIQIESGEEWILWNYHGLIRYSLY
jgi:hypothetical protein